jgi:hypothetical protein
VALSAILRALPANQLTALLLYIATSASAQTDRQISPFIKYIEFSTSLRSIHVCSKPLTYLLQLLSSVSQYPARNRIIPAAQLHK